MSELSESKESEDILLQLSSRLEEMRGKHRRILKKWGFFSCGSLIAGGLQYYFCSGHLGIFVFAVIIIVITILLYCIYSSEENSFYKENIISRLIHTIDLNLNYFPQRYISQAEYFQSEIFTTHVDRYRGEDLVQGKYKDIEVSFSELHTEYQDVSIVDGKRVVTWKTIFKGLFMVTDFHKNFKTKTMIKPDFAEAVFGNVIGKMFQNANVFEVGKLCKMEDPEFEKYFVVYSQNDIEARYLLSPKIMEAMTRIRKKFNNDIYFSFKDFQLFIAISTSKDFFEVSSFSGSSQEILRNAKNEITQILRIVDELELDVRIWSKK